ncbi:MAG: DUF3126 family protein [Alphaproteobacteria bacterium]|nr:hypothetical protein [Magnetovibrio sp.]UTW51399.1 DUF3126 family protein [bacterium SCSIO 12827]HCS69379.1 DUF3126 domain-containing protein [Rhodospirillaceae bacterium]|tara:strand:- start:146 stop:361 length:216 start_codon:yes stop_codon:yes gene_type:complete
MKLSEIARLQQYLRSAFDNNRFTVKPPKKEGHPVEVYLGEQFVGVLHRDEDEGEVSYSLQIAILEEDLPLD